MIARGVQGRRHGFGEMTMRAVRKNRPTPFCSFRICVGIGILFLTLLTGIHLLQAFAESQGVSDDYPQSLESLASSLLEQRAAGAGSRQLLLRLAEVYLDMGDDLYTAGADRLKAYRQGAEFAEQVLREASENAHAHFLYAANLGHVAQMEGIIASALSIHKIMNHAKMAVALDPSHAGALHMLGMMYDGLPWIMGGDQQEALNYLKRAVQADGSYTHAKLNLAKLYLKRQEYEAARDELMEILTTQTPRGSYAWSRYHVPEARELLRAYSLIEESVGVISDDP